MGTGVDGRARLRDREALGEPHTEHKREESDEMEHSDRFVRSQSGPCREFSRMLDSADRDEPTAVDRALVDRALLSLRATGTGPGGLIDADREIARAVDPEGPRWIRNTAASISILLLAAALVALVLYQPRPVPHARPVLAAEARPALAPMVVELAPARTSARGQRLLRNGAVVPFGSDLVEGDRIASGTAPGCLVIDPGIDVCLAAGTEITLFSLSRHGRAIDVQRGQVVARFDTLAPREGFELRGGAVRALTEGAVYSLERSGDALRVGVLQGKVSVLAGASMATVASGQLARYPGPAERVSVDTLRANFAVRVAELLEARSGTAAALPTVAGAAKPARTPPQSAISTRDPAATWVPDARLRLRAAWDQLKAQRWTEAGASYARILSDFPGTPEAHVVLVRLGDLQLDRLGAPEAALASYERYLREGGGPVEAEARYGRIRALARLGRPDAERGAIEEFLAVHPTSLKAPALNDRHRALSRDDESAVATPSALLR